MIEISRFQELSQNKNIILMKLIESEGIVKCLVNNESNFLDIHLPDDFDRTSLILSKVYPYRFVPTPQMEPQTFITMKFGYRPNGMTFKNGSIYFYIISHNSLLKTKYDMLRYDYLVNKIDELFNSSRDLGIGKLPFYDMDEFVVNENYSGVYIAYKTTEFQ
ncbi:MAG: hypothetical protein APF81_17680 [Desulfosporosinus sp. BRH_c37]|nr:MAG: hypothetical protein APF81_17680 [Desulfosporosinus sp. BRH_c37]